MYSSAFALAALAAVALTQAPQRSSVAAGQLNIEVVALDRKNLPVLDLKPGEFELWINKFQIPIQTVTFVTPSAEDGRTIVLLLDDMAVNPTMLPRIREAARRFVNRLSPGDTMAVVTLNGDAMDMTTDRARLLKAIDDYHVRNFPMRIDDAGEHVLQTITALSRQLAEASGGRKAIVGIGAGWLFDTPIPQPYAARDLRPEWVDAMRATASAHVSLYVIDPAGVGTRPVTGGASGFARETGGYAFMNTNDATGAADRILTEMGTYYVLSVENPRVGVKDDLREVEVKVLRRGVTVRARRGIPPPP
jgi:VWFA-related protein